MLPFRCWPVALDRQGTSKQGTIKSMELGYLHFIGNSLNIKGFLLEFWDIYVLDIISIYACHIVVDLYLHSMLKGYFRQLAREGIGSTRIQLWRSYCYRAKSRHGSPPTKLRIVGDREVSFKGLYKPCHGRIYHSWRTRVNDKCLHHH